MSRDFPQLSVGGVAVSTGGGGGGGGVYDVFSGYGTGPQLGASAATADISSTHTTPSATYSLASDQVTVAAAGDYTITFAVSGKGATSSRTQVDAWLEVDTVEVGGSRVFLYMRQTDHGATGSATLTLALSAGAVVRLRALRIAGSAPVDLSATLHIDKRT